MRLTQPGVATTIFTAAAIAIAIFLAFWGLTLFSLRADHGALRARISAAFAHETLDPQSSWRLGDTDIGAHQYNDCLILFQALDDRAPAALRGVSPLSVPVNTDNSCGVLADFAAGRIQPQTRYYHQYLHAHTSLARLLVPFLGVAGLRGFYKLALTLTLLAGIGYALIGLARQQRVAEHAAWLVIFVAFSRWFGLESFGQSLGHGPADLVPLLFLLFLLRASTEAPIAPRAAITASAILGALTMQFEFLTGGLPIGLAIVVGALPLALPCRDDMAFTVIRSVLAYASAVAVTVMAKTVLVSLAFGSGELIDTGHQFMFRMGLSQSSSRDTPADGSEFFTHIWAGLESLAPGMHFFVLGMIVIAATAAAWSYCRLRVAPHDGVRLRATALLGSMLLPPLWMVTFWQHTSEHAWFMDRILVWIIAAGGALFVLALVPSTEMQRDPPVV